MISVAEGVDFTDLTGLGIGALLLTLVFRTFWRQDGGWRSIMEASREDARIAREDAAAARVDAEAARLDARQARSAERECQRRLRYLAQAVDELRAESGRHGRRLDTIDRDSGEVPITDPDDPSS